MRSGSQLFEFSLRRRPKAWNAHSPSMLRCRFAACLHARQRLGEPLDKSSAFARKEERLRTWPLLWAAAAKRKERKELVRASGRSPALNGRGTSPPVAAEARRRWRIGTHEWS